MIGRARGRYETLRGHRGAIAGTFAILLVAGVFSQRPADALAADPVGAARARAALSAAVNDAASRLHALHAMVEQALVDGRMGAALTVSGSENPGPHLTAAAADLGGAEAQAVSCREALARIAGQLAILRPSAGAPILQLDPGALASTAGQLATSADAADAFRAMRVASQATLTELGAALAALDRSDPVTALAALDRADAQLAAVRAWPGQLDTLPIWVEATSKLLSSARAIAVAARDGDAAALARARSDYRAATGDARQADLALAIAIAEGGGAVSGAPLQALAAEQSAIDAAISAVGEVGHGA